MIKLHFQELIGVHSHDMKMRNFPILSKVRLLDTIKLHFLDKTTIHFPKLTKAHFLDKTAVHFPDSTVDHSLDTTTVHCPN
jgi:hypothetical protein